MLRSTRLVTVIVVGLLGAACVPGSGQVQTVPAIRDGRPGHWP
jgi:hypothetical protein